MKLKKNEANDSYEITDDYIRVTNGSLWLFLVMMLLVLGAVLLWGNLGRVPVKLTVSGVGLNLAYGNDDDFGSKESVEAGHMVVDSFVCLVNPNHTTAEKLNGKRATIVLNDGTKVLGETFIGDTVPLSGEEIDANLSSFVLDSHWATDRLDTGGYRYVVYVLVYEPLSYLQYGEVAKVVIETDQVPPIYYLFK